MKSKQNINCFPLSSPQREIWFDQKLHPESPLYNIGGHLQINGPIDPSLFETAVNLLVKRHHTLRTLIVPGDEEVARLTFLEDLPITVPFHDFSEQNSLRESALDWMQKQFLQPFDMYKKQLFQFALLKINDNFFFWLNKYHHIIIDGLGISLIVQSLSEIYTEL